MPSKLTLGAEEELHLVDLETWRLCPRAPQVLAQLPESNFKFELQRTTVETNTDVVQTLAGLRAELLNRRRQVMDAAEAVGAGIAAVGTAPRSEDRDFELTATGRFARMQEQYRLLVDEQLICGLQVHVGVAGRDLAVQIAQRVERDVPALLALSASSPYWNGEDTGYASIRYMIWQRWPSAGAMGPVGSAAEYDDMLDDLVATGVISDQKMAYFDVRPSSHEYATIELRVCDGCPIVDDAVLIAGLFRAVVRAAEQDIEAGRKHAPRAVPVQRAAMWQAARGGLSGRLLDSTVHPKPGKAIPMVLEMVKRLRPHLEELGDWEEVRQMTNKLVVRGNSADRQRAAFAEHGDLDDVMRLVVQETHAPAPGPEPHTPPLAGYIVRAGDEAVLRTGEPRPTYRGVLQWVRDHDEEAIRGLHKKAEAWELQRGLTFGHGAGADAYPVDLVPRLIQEHEWRDLAAGLTQRARALELFLRDVYGEQRVIKDGIVPGEQVTGIPGFRAEAKKFPPDTVRAVIQGFDLVRNEFGGWRVLEDNLRTPSGIAYANGVRELTDAVAADMPRPEKLLDPHAAYRQLRDTLFSGLGPDATGAVLTTGADNKAFFEHKTIAEGAGLLIVTPDDVERKDGLIIHKPSGKPLDVICPRLDEDLVDLEAKDGRRVGPDIVDVAAAGRLRLANVPGNGVADDKAVYTYVPELIRYYLDEHPLLESVPTYRTADPGERRTVLERVGQLVTKPVDGYGGAGVLVGPKASAAEVRQRRLEIEKRPGAWVAQEVVALSSSPTFDAGGALAPRHVDLRVFVLLRGTGEGDAVLADVALTRVAPPGSMVVNSSKGGGAKDTWIVAGDGVGRSQGMPEERNGSKP